MTKGEFEPLEIPEAPSAVACLQLHVVFGRFTEAQDDN